MAQNMMGSDLREDSGVTERGEGERTMPLLSGMMRSEEAAGEEALPAPKMGSSWKNTVLLLAVFAVGGVSLYAMRRSQTELMASETARVLEEKIDTALAAHQGRAASDDAGTAAIVDLFSADPSARQVPLAEVQKNPFVTPVIAEPTAAPTPTTGSAAAVKPVRDRLAELRKELAGFKLQTVMHGAHPLAIVNSQIVKPGQKLGSFKVIDIGERVVRLDGEGSEFVLSME